MYKSSRTFSSNYINTVRDKKNATFIAAIFIHFRYTKHGIWYTKMLTRLWSFLCENFISLSYASQFLLQIEIAAKKWRFPKFHSYFFKSDLFVLQITRRLRKITQFCFCCIIKHPSDFVCHQDYVFLTTGYLTTHSHVSWVIFKNKDFREK